MAIEQIRIRTYFLNKLSMRLWHGMIIKAAQSQNMTFSQSKSLWTILKKNILILLKNLLGLLKNILGLLKIYYFYSAMLRATMKNVLNSLITVIVIK